MFLHVADFDLVCLSLVVDAVVLFVLASFATLLSFCLVVTNVAALGMVCASSVVTFSPKIDAFVV